MWEQAGQGIVAAVCSIQQEQKLQLRSSGAWAARRVSCSMLSTERAQEVPHKVFRVAGDRSTCHLGLFECISARAMSATLVGAMEHSP